jgi:hypothetical protein
MTSVVVWIDCNFVNLNEKLIFASCLCLAIFWCVDLDDWFSWCIVSWVPLVRTAAKAFVVLVFPRRSPRQDLVFFIQLPYVFAWGVSRLKSLLTTQVFCPLTNLPVRSLISLSIWERSSARASFYGLLSLGRG